jgi:hypothetical protein
MYNKLQTVLLLKEASMKKWIFNILFCLAVFHSAFAGNFFTIQASGAPANISAKLCLNAKASLSCQNYTASGTNLHIRTTMPNRAYPSAGIQITTPGYQATQCTQLSNGYCQFSANDKTSTPIVVTTGSDTTKITVSGSPLVLLPSMNGTTYTSTLTVTNISSTDLHNIAAVLPSTGPM